MQEEKCSEATGEDGQGLPAAAQGLNQYRQPTTVKQGGRSMEDLAQKGAGSSIQVLWRCRRTHQ